MRTIGTPIVPLRRSLLQKCFERRFPDHEFFGERHQSGRVAEPRALASVGGNVEAEKVISLTNVTVETASYARVGNFPWLIKAGGSNLMAPEQRV